MSNRRQQSLRKAFGACGMKTSAVENDEVATYNQVALTLISPIILISVTTSSNLTCCLVVVLQLQPSAATVTQAGDGEIEFELLNKPHQPRSGQEFSLRGNLVNLFLCIVQDLAIILS